MSSISRAAAWVGGATFLVLCFYITIDVLGRRYGGPYSGVTDEISGYVLAIAGTLGLAHAMRIGAHVRIDLLLPRFSPAVRYFLNLTNAATIAFFAILLTWYGWASTHLLVRDRRTLHHRAANAADHSARVDGGEFHAARLAVGRRWCWKAS